MKEMKKSSKEMEQAAKDNEESKQRTVFMVVLNSTLNFMTRAPLLIQLMNDLKILIFTSDVKEVYATQSLTRKEFNSSFFFQTILFSF